jgi:hypothetical protein
MLKAMLVKLKAAQENPKKELHISADFWNW